MPALTSAPCSEVRNAGLVAEAPDTAVIVVDTVVDETTLVRTWLHRLGMAEALIAPESDVVGYVAQQPVTAFAVVTMVTWIWP